MFASTPKLAPLRTALLGLALLAAPITLHAQQRLRGVVRLGLEYGGEKVVGFEYDDGTTPDVTAGGGGLLTVGAVYRAVDIGRSAIEAQLNVGLKYRTIPPATNQNATWLRYPVEAMLFFRAPASVRFGLGPTWHFANALKTSGEVSNEKLSFSTSPGLLLQAEYVRKEWGVDLRYTALEYKVSSGGGTVGASNVGIGASYFFPRR